MSKEGTLKQATLRQLLQAIEARGEDATRAALQAVIEGRPMGESSLDDKFVVEFEEVKFTEKQLRDDRWYLSDGEVLKRHRNGGGWVPLEQDEFDESKPFVAETAYVGPYARVFGGARVFGYARIFGNAEVYGNAEVFGNAQVYGNARVCGNARVFNNARVFDIADVFDGAQIFGNAQVYGNAQIFDNAQVYGNARVYGTKIVNKDTRLTSGSHNA